MYTAIETDLQDNVIKVTGPYLDVDAACKAYGIPENHRNVALEDAYKFNGPGFGPFVSIRPVTSR